VILPPDFADPQPGNNQATDRNTVTPQLSAREALAVQPEGNSE